MKIQELSAVEAQQLFEQLPMRISTLSPQFACADTAREEGLRCVHLAVRDANRVWLNSIHKPRCTGGFRLEFDATQTHAQLHFCFQSSSLFRLEIGVVRVALVSI